MHLSPAQQSAVVGIFLPDRDAWCSGTLIASQVVLTTSHCFNPPDEQIAVNRIDLILIFGDISLGGFSVEVVRNEQVDAALLLFDAPPLEGIARPISLGTASAEVGELLQVAGYGYDEAGQIGRLRFGVSSVVERDEMFLTVSTDGASGLCAGDSGGPAMTRGPDGAVTVVGVMIAGSASCRGSDRYLRTTAFLSWVREWLSSLDVESHYLEPPGDIVCAELGAVGRCFGQRAVWCDTGGVTAAACAGGSRCGWEPGAGGFRCIAPPSDPCNGYTDLGDCDGQTAITCQGGDLTESQCGACGATCSRDPVSGRVGCWAPAP